MKIIILAIGKEKDFYANDLVIEYTKRVTHYCSCEWKYIPSVSSREDNNKLFTIIEKEKQNSYIIALDENGKEFTSEAFSDQIQMRMNQSVKKLIFIIGGSYGLNQEIRDRANFVMSLSKMTFPHQLVRLILIEQLYRAFTIIRKENYHHR